MIKFAKRFIRPSGSPFRNVYKLKISAVTGAEELEKAGVENWQEFIDASVGSCDLAAIIARVNAGEVDLLTKTMGEYGDFRKIPTNPAEVMQMRIDAKKVFDSLTSEQRSNFNSFDEFAGSAGSEDWIKKLGYEIPKVEVDVKKEG